MAGVAGTFVPTYQGLSAAHLVRPAIALRAPEDEGDLEIDEEFLKRVRDV